MGTGILLNTEWLERLKYIHSSMSWTGQSVPALYTSIKDLVVGMAAHSCNHVTLGIEARGL